MNSRRILVIAPHADDEILGCGATIAKHVSSGDEVSILVATNAHVGAPELFARERIDLVRKEALDAHELLGVKETRFLDFPAPALDVYPSYKVANAILETIKEVRPDTLYIPFPGDIHLDHFMIHRASIVAARPQGNYTVKSIFCYETLSETEWASSHGANSFSPNCFVDVSACFSKKLDAMKCFTSQLREFPHSRSIEALDALAKYRGATIGVERAESFAIERVIN